MVAVRQLIEYDFMLVTSRHQASVLDANRPQEEQRGISPSDQ